MDAVMIGPVPSAERQTEQLGFGEPLSTLAGNRESSRLARPVPVPLWHPASSFETSARLRCHVTRAGQQWLLLGPLLFEVACDLLVELHDLLEVLGSRLRGLGLEGSGVSVTDNMHLNVLQTDPCQCEEHQTLPKHSEWNIASRQVGTSRYTHVSLSVSLHKQIDRAR